MKHNTEGMLVPPEAVSTTAWHIVFTDVPKTALYITPGFEVHGLPMPNWWWRMWQFLLLGWRWATTEEEANENSKA